METRSSTYELEGKVKVIEDIRTFPSGFTKREFIVTTEERFPQDIKLECLKEKCDLLNDHQVGNTVKVSFNLRGNEYNGRYFVNLQAWRIEKGTSEQSSDAPEPAPEESLPGDDEDSPF
jgi:single-strand DNA-binding protein